MSIISANKETIKKARRKYEGVIVKAAIAEHNAMNEMLDVLRASDGLLTAAQVETACTSGISKHEVAGNLRAMRNLTSRYEHISSLYGQEVPRVNMPSRYNPTERIVAKGGGKREAVMVELDENGHIVPNSKRTVMLNESKLYGIEKI